MMILVLIHYLTGAAHDECDRLSGAVGPLGGSQPVTQQSAWHASSWVQK
jgi:hypothetical protein